jgi:hypothetical protein
MKTTQRIFVVLIGLLLMPWSLLAQSAVYVYKNPRTGEGDYMVVYGMPTEAEATFLAQEKLVELGYAEELIMKQVSVSGKGFGMVVKGVYQNRYGKEITVFGASLGCKSGEQAKQEAIQNLKKYNPDWAGNEAELEEVQKFIDR